MIYKLYIHHTGLLFFLVLIEKAWSTRKAKKLLYTSFLTQVKPALICIKIIKTVLKTLKNAQQNYTKGHDTVGKPAPTCTLSEFVFKRPQEGDRIHACVSMNVSLMYILAFFNAI